MKHDDTTLQAAIDAAMLDIKIGTGYTSLDTYQSYYWHKESTARLDLAKAFLAKLPEPEPILADDGRSLGRIAQEACDDADAKALTTEECYESAAQAVANVVLAQAIRRMEAIPEQELEDLWYDTPKLASEIRARLIAAARGEVAQQADSTDWKARAEKAETERKKWEEDALRYCKNADYWKSQAETIGILRPLSEAGPVPDGCVRVTALKGHKDDWAIGDSQSQHDTHFTDIRLPVTETPAQTVNEQPRQQVPLGPEDVMPGSVIQGVSSPSWHWISVVSVHQIQAKLAGHCGDIGTDRPTWEELKLAAKINRSIPLTGKWDANAWEPCSKPGKEVAK